MTDDDFKYFIYEILTMLDPDDPCCDDSYKRSMVKDLKQQFRDLDEKGLTPDE